ncbi:hypothetical protein Athai_14200 [Actinocatenispora thailandica]|uniref:DUF4440 domain-containing protein n=1 Tax=Actinocatenispora thailandica TaxID=227318 RepID=A0A7R7DM66_9ACTN|nr:SgcJ/EcaC family oxidoreductase [Actinocatenispora thailandica]BCJ33917.1 hypothetical protein Athai_14200 [Actinocatenispora thailandica]
MTLEQDTVQDYLDRVRQAWDAGDAARYAAEFADDASYVIFLGDALLGRAAIEQTHHEVFTRWQRGTRMVVEPIDVRILDPDTAVVTTIGGIGTTDPIDFDKFQTYTLRRSSGRWQCVAFHNTEMSTRAKHTYATR